MHPLTVKGHHRHTDWVRMTSVLLKKEAGLGRIRGKGQQLAPKEAGREDHVQGALKEGEVGHRRNQEQRQLGVLQSFSLSPFPSLYSLMNCHYQGFGALYFGD